MWSFSLMLQPPHMWATEPIKNTWELFLVKKLFHWNVLYAITELANQPRDLYLVVLNFKFSSWVCFCENPVGLMNWLLYICCLGHDVSKKLIKLYMHGLIKVCILVLVFRFNNWIWNFIFFRFWKLMMHKQIITKKNILSVLKTKSF